MPTVQNDPTSNINTLWFLYDFTKIDDGIRFPTTTGFDASFTTTDEDDDGDEQKWGANTVPATGKITAVTVYFFGRRATDDIDVNANYAFNGSWGTQSAAVSVNSASNAWYSRTWSGLSISVTSGNSVSFSLEAGAIAKGEELTIEGAYIEVTYTTAGEPPITSPGSIPNKIESGMIASAMGAAIGIQDLETSVVG